MGAAQEGKTAARRLPVRVAELEARTRDRALTVPSPPQTVKSLENFW